MEYSDDELLDWWRKLSQTDKAELFSKMAENSYSEAFKKKVEFMRTVWMNNGQLTAAQIATVRRWES